MVKHPLIQQYIEHNAFGRLLGMEFNIQEPGVCIYSCSISEELTATPRAAHGGFVASILDATMGVGALSLVCSKHQVVSTLEIKVSFLRPALKNLTVYCTSKCLQQGATILFMEAELVNDQNQIIAIGSGTFKSYNAEKAGY